MAGGAAFDPAEFAAFKSGLAPAGGGREPATVPAGDAFDPAEFAAFKASRQGGGAPASFSQRFDAAPPMSRSEAAPRVGYGSDASIGGSQAGADALFAGMRRTADEALVGKPSARNAAETGLYRLADTLGLNLPRNAMAAGHALQTGEPFDQSYRYVQDVQDALSRQNPKSSIAGTAAGIVGGAVALPAFRAAEGAGIVGRGIANAATGGAYSFLGDLADTKDAYSAGAMAGVGGVLGGVGGAVIEKAAPVVSRLFVRNAPFRGADGALTGEARAALREAGIDPAAVTPELASHIDQTFAAKGPSAAAAREAMAAEQGITLSAGQASQDPRVAGFEARALAGRGGARAQGVAQGFADRQAGEIAAAGERLQGMVAGDAPRIADPRAAYEATAERARRAATDLAERRSVAQRGVDDGLRAVRGRGDFDALDGATAAAQGLREAAAQSKAGYQGAYRAAAAVEGEFRPGSFDRLGERARADLGPGLPIDEVVTPNATRALSDLDNLPQLLAKPDGSGASAADVETIRRRLLAYRSGTAQNPTDRSAVDSILRSFTDHAEGAEAAGLFGPRQAPAPRELAGDGFPGFPAPSAGPGPGSAAGGAPAGRGEPEGLTRFLARTGGVPLDAEARAADLHKTYIPGAGTLARRDAPTWDDIRVRLAEEGFLPPGLDGAASARDVADWARDAIHAERTGGRATVRMADEGAVGAGRRAMDRVADENAAYAERMAPFRQQVVDDLAESGVRARDVDPAHLDDAAARLYRGEHDHGADAFEAAVMAREGRGAGGAGRNAPPPDAAPFDGPTAIAASDALPGGSTELGTALRNARSMFREHQQAFRPRGPGDVAGQRLQRIVERDASPNEVAAMLFGSPGTGRVSGGQLQTLARVRDAVGGDSDAWRETQRALIARHLGGEGRDLGVRLDYLLRGDGRTLAQFLTDEQRSGLGRLRAAVVAAENAHAPMPGWASDLERSGFDPNRIAHGIFGGSEMGSRVGAANEARAAKAFLGADSAEWSSLRQAAVQRLTGAGDGPGGAGRVADQVRAFVDGSGKGVAEALFTPSELGHLRRFGMAVRSTLAPDGTIRPDAGARLDAVKVAFDRLGHMVALHAGGIPGAAVSIGAKVLREQAGSVMGARAARRSFEGGAPRTLAPVPLPPLGQLAVGGGLAVGQR